MNTTNVNKSIVLELPFSARKACESEVFYLKEIIKQKDMIIQNQSDLVCSLKEQIILLNKVLKSENPNNILDNGHISPSTSQYLNRNVTSGGDLRAVSSSDAGPWNPEAAEFNPQTPFEDRIKRIDLHSRVRTYEGRGQSEKIDPHSRYRTYIGRCQSERIGPRSRDRTYEESGQSERIDPRTRDRTYEESSQSEKIEPNSRDQTYKRRGQSERIDPLSRDKTYEESGQSERIDPRSRDRTYEKSNQSEKIDPHSRDQTYKARGQSERIDPRSRDRTHEESGQSDRIDSCSRDRTYEGRGHSDRIDPHSRDRTYEGRGRVEPHSRDQERGDYHGRGRYQGNKNLDSQRDDRRPSEKSYSRTPKEKYGNSLPGNRNQFDGNEENWNDCVTDSNVSEDQQHLSSSVRNESQQDLTTRRSYSRKETIDNWEPDNVSDQLHREPPQRVKKETSDVGSQKTSSVWNTKFSSKAQHFRSLADSRMERENKSSRESHSREETIDNWEPDNVFNQPHGELQRVKKLKTPDVGSQKTSSVSERHTNESHVQKKDNSGKNKEYDAWNDYYDDGWNENVKQRKSFPKSNIKDASSVSKRQTSESHVQKKESLGMNKEYDAWNDDYDDGWNENVKQRKSFPKSNIKDASSVSKGQTNESHVQKK